MRLSPELQEMRRVCRALLNRAPLQEDDEFIVEIFCDGLSAGRDPRGPNGQARFEEIYAKHSQHVPRRGSRRPKVEKIVEAQRGLISMLQVGRVEPDREHCTCWACGTHVDPPERAHVHAFSMGGSDHPSNFFLLCSLCHLEQPELASVEDQIAWLIHHGPMPKIAVDYLEMRSP